MELIKPSSALLIVWRLRLSFITLLPASLSAFFFSHIGWVWWTCTLLWVAAFFYFYIFYYPIKLRKLALGSNESFLLIHCGVIYTRVKAIPFSAIQYTTIATTPLSRLFGVCALIVRAPGAGAYMPGILPAKAKVLQLWLSQKSAPAKESSDG